MHIPSRPPTLAQSTAANVRSNADLDTLIGSLEQAGGAAPGGRYRHWDSLRRNPPPDGLEHPHWWLAIKLARASISRELPLRNVAGGPFKFVPAEAVWHLLGRVDSLACEPAEQLVVRRTRDALLFRQAVDEAIASSQIEGSPMTRRDAVELVRENRPPRDVGERMVVNNYRALCRVRDLAKESVTPALIVELHRILTDGALDPSDVGQLRRDGDKVHIHDQAGSILHTPPPAAEIRDRLDVLCAFANDNDPESSLHPIVRSILVHFQLAHDHPFRDGNGRLARVLFTWSMLHHRYDRCAFWAVSKVLKEDPSRYTRAFLYVESDEDDTTYFVLNQLAVLLRAATELAQYLERKPMELRQMGRFIEDATPWHGRLNHRQIDVMRHALQNPGHTYTIGAHRRSHGTSYQTSRTDLLAMAAQGVLVRAKQGKKFVFTVPDDLDGRLRILAG